MTQDDDMKINKGLNPQGLLRKQLHNVFWSVLFYPTLSPPPPPPPQFICRTQDLTL